MDRHLARQLWFISLNGKRHGPFTFATLSEAARNGIITAETKVWRQGWKRWHPARQVPGLLNEAPLAPDDTSWAEEQAHSNERARSDEQARSSEEAALLYAPPHRRGIRPSADHDALGERQQRRNPALPENPTEHIFAEEWRVLAERPPQDRDDIRGTSWFGRKKTPKTVDVPETRDDGAECEPATAAEMDDEVPFADRFRRFWKRTAIGMSAILLLVGAGWLLLNTGPLRQPAGPKPANSTSAASRSTTVAAADDLPTAVASLPAVVALQRNDPAAFERFKKRYAASAVNAQEDELLSIARAALRKSVKHLLAIASGDVLLEITETSLAYMQGLQDSNPESCVALSDESKGARLTSNLAKELPVQFVRDMSVLERIAGTNPHTTIAPLTAEEARPYLETVFNGLRAQPLRSELLGHDKLDPSEFQPYCALVIAFYRAVLDLPRDDKVNLLRYLYAAAAVNADSDLAR